MYQPAAFRATLLCLPLMLGGCAFRAKNIKPVASYDFTFLTEMARYAQAAYGDDAAIREFTRPTFNETHIQVIAATNNKYFLATSSATQIQLISIAGTANLENVLLDADFSQELNSALQIPLHRGFAKAAHLIWDDLKPRLKPGYRVWVTGHSLGGAEALIIGMLLKSEGTPAEFIVTFGQPKVTTKEGVEAFADLTLIRVVNQKDGIPTVPLAPYRHLAPELVLFPGPTYSLVQERPLKTADIQATWDAIKNRQAPDALPDHYLANYLTNLDSKRATSEYVLYPN